MVVNSNDLQPTWVLPTAWRFTQMYPQYTQIQLNIISVLLFWDVLWIINDLLAPLSLFFHEFQQNSQVFTDNIKRSRSTQIYNKISPFKTLIYKNYFYIFTNILILKTILVFLSLCSWFKAIAMWASGMSNHRKKRSILIISRFHICIHIKKKEKE